jgi:purine-binding chemotaxis protein CheW
LNENDRSILKARAKALARLARQDSVAHRMDIVVFQLAHEMYAVEASFVSEVYPLRELTTLPGTPPFVLGIVNVRGRIVSIVNLKSFFNLPEKGLTDFNKVIVITDGRMEFGLLSDALLGLRSVSSVDIHSSLAALPGIGADFTKGVTPDRIVILDSLRLLSEPRLVIHQTVE